MCIVTRNAQDLRLRNGLGKEVCRFHGVHLADIGAHGCDANFRAAAVID